MPFASFCMEARFIYHFIFFLYISWLLWYTWQCEVLMLSGVTVMPAMFRALCPPQPSFFDTLCHNPFYFLCFVSVSLLSPFSVPVYMKVQDRSTKPMNKSKPTTRSISQEVPALFSSLILQRIHFLKEDKLCPKIWGIVF